MAILDEAERLAQAGDTGAAVALISRAADAGQADAMVVVAQWRIFALNGPRDLTAARALLGRAATAGSDDAAELLATLLANGTGGAADPAAAAALLAPLAARRPAVARMLALLDRPDPALQLVGVSGDPRIARVPGFLSADECAWLVERGGPGLQPSFIHDAGGTRRRDPVRTSEGAGFGPTQEDPVVARINRRIAAVSGCAPAQGEPLHLLRYRPGQEYRMHHDAIPGARNQRTVTVLLYLNDGYDGGGTRFPELDLTVRGEAGEALLFLNVTADGRPDPRMAHAGEPVTRGEKWLATRWNRQRPYHPWAPETH